MRGHSSGEVREVKREKKGEMNDDSRSNLKKLKSQMLLCKKQSQKPTN